MIFQRHLADLILAGEKTQTRRRLSDNPRSPWWWERCRYEPGQIVAVNPGRGIPRVGDIEITEVRKEHLLWITQADAQAEGFPDATAFVGAWRRMHGKPDRHERVWVLRFQLVQ